MATEARTGTATEVHRYGQRLRGLVARSRGPALSVARSGPRPGRRQSVTAAPARPEASQRTVVSRVPTRPRAHSPDAGSPLKIAR